LIKSYNGTTKVATVAKSWVVAPDATSEFVLSPADVDVELWNDVSVTGDGDWSELQTDVDAILVDTAEIGSAGAGLTGVGLSAAAVDAIWDEALSGHTSAGTTGKAITDIETDATAILADTNELQTDDVPGLIAALNDPTAAVIADAVLDEALSGHVTAGTLGKAVADIETDAAAILVDTGTTLQAELDGIQADTEDIQTQIGTAGAGLTAIPTQDANVVEWNGTAVATPTTAGIPNVGLDEIKGSSAAADALSNYFASLDTQVNVASATSTTIVFDDAAMSAVDDYYNGMVVMVYGGTGAGQARRITDYTGATKTATVDPSWGTDPDATSDVIVMPGPGDIAGTAPTAAAVADAVWDEAQADHTTAGSMGESLNDASAGGGGGGTNNYEVGS
jgi:hypothetical protein